MKEDSPMLRLFKKTWSGLLAAIGLGMLVPSPVFAATSLTDDVMILIARIMSTIAGFFGKIFIAATDFLIWALNFNDFINVSFVRAGWVVTRDLANSLFIVVLLIISFAIIFGREEYGSIKSLPKLFIMAIAINFSRTIAGFIIDIAQVFTLTFASAFKAAGAGNFAELFGVSELVSYQAPAFTGDIGASAMISAAFGLITMVISTIVVGTLAITVLYRTVALWVLIILAPLMWFMSIVPKFGASYYSQWWDEFKKNVMMAPILAFFVWLALATAAATSAEFTKPGADGSQFNGTMSVADSYGATYNSLIRGVITIIILLKGLEIAMKSGAQGSQWLGTGKKKIEGFLGKSMGLGAVAGGAAAVGGALIRGGEAGFRRATGMNVPLATDLLKQPSIAGYAKTRAAQGLQGLASLGTGQDAGRVAKMLGSVVAPVAAGLGAGAYATKLAQAGAKETKGAEKAMEAKIATVGSGGDAKVAFLQLQQIQSLKNRADTEIAALGDTASDAQKDEVKRKYALTKEQEVQYEALMKDVVDNEGKYGKVMSQNDVEAFNKNYTAQFKGKSGDMDKLKTFQEKQFDKFTAASQATILESFAPSQQAKVLSKAIVMDDKKKDDTQEVKRIEENLKKIDNKAIGKYFETTEDPGARKKIIEHLPDDRFVKAVNDGSVKYEQFYTTEVKNMSDVKATAVLSSVDSKRFKASMENPEERAVAMEKFKAWREKDSTRNVGEKTQDLPTMQINLKHHLAMSKDKPGEAVDASQTLGWNQAGEINSAQLGTVNKNIVTIMRSKKDGADLIENLHPAQATQDVIDAITQDAKATVTALNEVAKRIIEGDTETNDQLEGVVQRVVESIQAKNPNLLKNAANLKSRFGIEDKEPNRS